MTFSPPLCSFGHQDNAFISYYNHAAQGGCRTKQTRLPDKYPYNNFSGYFVGIFGRRHKITSAVSYCYNQRYRQRNRTAIFNNGLQPTGKFLSPENT